jgi:hypothetical protein
MSKRLIMILGGGLSFWSLGLLEVRQPIKEATTAVDPLRCAVSVMNVAAL